jgi:hypothetical protein
MIEQPFILLILSCKKYERQTILQKRTWLNHLPETFIYFHIIGDPSLPEDFLFDIREKILYVKTEDDYISIPKKMMAAYSAIAKTYNFKFLFKTDNNQNLLKYNLLNILSSLLTEEDHYGGKIVTISIKSKSMHHLLHQEIPDNLYLEPTQYCSGPFYFLSFKAIYNLLSKRELIDKEVFEDYAIGYHLDKQFKENIMPIKTDNYFSEIK